MSTNTNDLDRLRRAYAERDRRACHLERYSHWSVPGLFAAQQLQRATLSVLRSQGFSTLKDRCILEVGCGSGGVLLDCLVYGATPERLHGTDLIIDRVSKAHARLPNLQLTCADAQNLPYQTGSFDLVLQYTVFSSILDEAIKANLAKEMLRVLKGSQGLILWYDFWLNPVNPDTRGIRPNEIRRLFPGCEFQFRRITLAPPIARRVAPYSWTLASFLESARFLNTHYLVAIIPS